MKQIYGIDLSQKKFDVNFLDDKGLSKSFIVKNNLKGIVKFLEKLPENAVLCAEHTGIYGELLLFLAPCFKIPISYTSGYAIRHSLGLLKGKTDKLDAERIREYGERFFDKLRLTEYPEEELRELKELFRLRSQLVKERKMLLTQNNGKQYAPFNSLKANKISNGVIEYLSKSIKEIEAEIHQVISLNKELLNNYNIVTDVDGIGQITACNLIMKTGNFKVIDTAKKAASYSGVCPFPNSSGKMVKKSKVSQMADKELKTLLHLCALSAMQTNPEIKLYYMKKKQEGKAHFLIMNNISNKLLRIIYSTVKSKERYLIGHKTEDPRKLKKSA